MLTKIFGPQRDEVTGEWRRLYNEKLHDLYSLPNIIWVYKSRRIRWPWHVAHKGERRGGYSGLVGKPEIRDHLQDLGIDGRILLKFIFKNKDGGA